ncbi:hypothetical protein NQ317_014090 [Molorchus minor]|uniref:Uncharacterized protein n=1 Tax=Molorchus minor TaxID=1323400 RepID=A0ABQ9IZN3_9CUCU|nr:hypothetical protein NQ317_014090 [Molorchus minor]
MKIYSAVVLYRGFVIFCEMRGHRLIRNPKISVVINKLFSTRKKITDLCSQWVLLERVANGLTFH